jgi:succinoglycan biosynthesis protein ExoL
MNVAYFVHELADAAVRRRLAMLTAGGCNTTLLGFARDRGAGAEASDGIVLGRTHNQRFFQRALAVLAALPRALRAQELWRECDVILARNLEMLALVVVATRLLQPRARIVYECLDIHRLMSSTGLVGSMLRALERACLKRVALVITSSPAFERRHFRGTQRYGGDLLLIENKVLALAPTPEAPAPNLGPPWRIAWCGVLRCKRSFELMCELVRNEDGRVLVDLWGVPALDQIPDFHAAVTATPGMAYHGRYTAEDLPRIYGGAHFAWAIDFYEAGGNSDWLLPNRLYESLAFGAPPIAIEGLETALWLKRHDVGIVLEAPIDAALTRFFASLDTPAYDAMRARVAALPREATRETPETCAALVARIHGRAA